MADDMKDIVYRCRVRTGVRVVGVSASHARFNTFPLRAANKSAALHTGLQLSVGKGHNDMKLGMRFVILHE